MKTYNFDNIIEAIKIKIQFYIDKMAKENPSKLYLGLGASYNIGHESLHIDLGLADQNTKSFTTGSDYVLQWEIITSCFKNGEILNDAYIDYNKYCYDISDKLEGKLYYDFVETNKNKFQKDFLIMLNALDYTKIKKTPNFFCWACDEDGSFWVCDEQSIPLNARQKLFGCKK